LQEISNGDAQNAKGMEMQEDRNPTTSPHQWV